MDENSVVPDSGFTKHENDQDVAAPLPKPRRNSILKVKRPNADTSTERPAAGQRERRTSWADKVHTYKVEDNTQEPREQPRSSRGDCAPRNWLFGPQILSRLKKIRENFKDFDTRDYQFQDRGPQFFCGDSPHINRRYYLLRSRFNSGKQRPKCLLETAGPVVTKMNITPRVKRVEARKRSRAKSDDKIAKFEVLKQEILEDISWCISHFESMMGTRHGEEFEKLRNQMTSDFSSLFSSKEERPLAAYLKDFLGHRPDTVTTFSVPLSHYQSDVDDQEYKMVTVNPKMSFLLMSNNWDSFVAKDPVKSILADRHKWGLDVFEVAEHTHRNPLITLVLTIFSDWGFQTKFKIPNEVLVQNLLEVEGLYRTYLPYHNSLHAADVFISAHVILRSHALENIFTDLEIFACLYAAACHDIDHPGVNNNFLIRMRSKMAALYDNKSVLEHHHIQQSLAILDTEQFNILQNLKPRDVRLFKSILKAVIIATDPVQHTNLFTDLKIIAEERQRFDAACSLMSDTKIYILQSIVHCCDIGNPLKPLDQYQNWVDRIMTEFFHQGDMEKAKGLEPSPMCDRNTTNITKCQVGFIDYIVKPIWKTLAEIISPDGDDLLLIMDRNREFYVHHTIPRETMLNMVFSNHSAVEAESTLSAKWGTRRSSVALNESSNS